MAVARKVASLFVEDLPEGFQSRRGLLLEPGRRARPAHGRSRGGAARAERARGDNGTALGDAIACSVDLGVSSLDEELAAARADDPGDRARPLRRREHDRRLRAARGRPAGGRRRGTRLHGRPGHGRGHHPGPGRLPRHADHRRSTGPRALTQAAEHDRRPLLRGRRRGRAPNRLRRDRLAGRRRAGASGADGCLHGRRCAAAPPRRSPLVALVRPHSLTPRNGRR